MYDWLVYGFQAGCTNEVLGVLLVENPTAGIVYGGRGRYIYKEPTMLLVGVRLLAR